MALFVMEEPHVGPTVVMLILSPGVVWFRALVVDVVVLVEADVVAVAPALAVVVVVGLAVVEVVVVVGVDGRACAAVTSNSAFFTLSVDGGLLALRQVVQVRLHIERLLVPAAEQLDRRVDQAGAAERIGGLRLGDPGRRDGPLGPTFELNAEIQPAAQDDRNDSEDDDRRREAEPDLAFADEVEARLASVKARQRTVPLRLPGQEGTGGIIEGDQLLLVQTLRVDALFEVLDVSLGHVVERTAVAVPVLAAPPVVAHEPPPAPAPTGKPVPGACAGVCGPAPSPVAMLKAPEPCRRELCPIKMTSGRV